MRKQIRLRQQQQPGRFGSIRTHHDGFRSLKNFATALVEIHGARDSSSLINLNSAHIRVGPDLTSSGALCDGNDRRKRARLGSDLTAELLAKSAMQASAAAP